MFCNACGARVEGRWNYCRSCGADLMTVTASARATEADKGIGEAALAVAPNEREESTEDASFAAASGEPPIGSLEAAAPLLRLLPGISERFRRPAGAPLLAVGIIAGIIGLGAFAVWWRSDLRATQSQLAAVANELRSTEAEKAAVELQLDETTSRLAAVEADLRSTEAELEKRTYERDLLSVYADQLESDVSRLEGSLSETQSDLQAQQQTTTLQAGQIRVLRECLAGVVEALYWVTFEFWSLAVSALQRVSSACDQAAQLF